MSGNFIPLVSHHPDGVLRVVVVGRKSKPNKHNDNESIQASMEDAESYLERVYKGKVEIIRLGEQISGMVYDRATIRQLEDLIEEGWPDLIIVEDIGRMFRNPKHIHAFPQDCKDAGVRLIAIADQIDTEEENWETAVTIAATRHGLVVPDTRRRVRRSATFAFNNGGMVQRAHFGYRKLTREEAKSGQFGPVDLRIAKLPDWTSAVRLITAWFLKDKTYVWIADELNERNIPFDHNNKSKRWTGRRVAKFLRSELLGGFRKFRETLYERNYKTGKHKRKKNPGGPERKHYPDLAHLRPKTYERLRKKLQDRIANRGDLSSKKHPLQGKARSKSIFPAQHARCAICSGLMYAYDRHQFKCSRSHAECESRCWNHVQFDGRAARKRIIAWMLDVLNRFPTFREPVVEVAWTEFQRLRSRAGRSQDVIDQRISTLQREAGRLAEAIRVGGDIQSLVKLLQDVDGQLERASRERELQKSQEQQQCRFSSLDDVRDHLDEALFWMAANSHDFADFLRSILTRFDIVPVQALDSGLVRARANVTLSVVLNNDLTPTEFHGKIDLFDPPKHIEHFNECRNARLRYPDKSLKTLAKMLGLNYMTVKRANDYGKLMESLGMSEPYRELHAPPEKASRWRMSG